METINLSLIPTDAERKEIPAALYAVSSFEKDYLKALGEDDMEKDALNSISKPKLPKAYSYVLRSSQLNDLLISDGYTIYTDLVYWLPQVIGSIFEAHYWFPNIRVPYPRLYVRAGALPKGDIQKARILMSSEVLPKFSIWLGDVRQQNNHTQYHSKASPYFNAVYHENGCNIAIDL